MTSITARNAQALKARNGSTVPEAKPAPKKATPSKAAAPVVTPEIPKAAPTGVKCHCGCGTEAKPGRSYLPGHDARHAGAVGRALAAGAQGAEEAAAALPPKLAEKARRFAANRKNEATRKAEAAKLRAEMKAELERRLAELAE